MEQKNRSHGKIDNLPPELKKEVENRLLAGDTYEEVSEWLKKAGGGGPPFQCRTVRQKIFKQV